MENPRGKKTVAEEKPEEKRPEEKTTETRTSHVEVPIYAMIIIALGAFTALLAMGTTATAMVLVVMMQFAPITISLNFAFLGGLVFATILMLELRRAIAGGSGG